MSAPADLAERVVRELYGDHNVARLFSRQQVRDAIIGAWTPTAPVGTPEPQPARDAEGREVLSPLSLTSWPDYAQAPDDTKHVRDSQPRYSQYQMDDVTKPLHAEIERLRAVDTPPRVTDMPAIEVGDIIDDGPGGYGYMRVTGDDIGAVIAIPSTGDRDEARLVPLDAITAIYRTPLWRRGRDPQEGP